MLGFFLAVIVAAASAKPPVTPVRQVGDDYFGTKIVDPYRWLEDGQDPQVQAWSHAQAANAGPSPVYLRIEPKTGHGAGRPISKVIEEQVDELSFLFHELGIADGP